MGAPTVKQFYIKAEKGRDFLAPFSHDLACKVSCVIRYFVFGRNISDLRKSDVTHFVRNDVAPVGRNDVMLAHCAEGTTSLP